MFFYITKDDTTELMVILNSFQHLTASLYLPPSLGEILKQVQDDFGRFLLFLHSFWGSQFKTYVKSKRSPLNVKHFYFCPSNLKWFQNEQKSIKIVQKQT